METTRDSVSNTGQLWKRILSRMSVRISIVIVLASGASYWHIITILKKEAVHTLEKYIHERGEREQRVFDQVKKNQQLYLTHVNHILGTWTESDRETLSNLFKTNTELNRAGVRRQIKKGYDGTRMPSIYIGNNYPHPENRFALYQVLYETVKSFGTAYSTSYFNFYATTRDNICIGYAPNMPAWAFHASDNLDVTKEEYVLVALKERNPKRVTAYTGVYFDIPGQVWMVTATTPYDDKAGNNLFNIATDITIEEIFSRTLNDHLEGAFNFLASGDGALIADKNRMDEIKKHGGRYNLIDSKDPNDSALRNILESIQRHSVETAIVIDDPNLDDILAVYRLKGPNWFFVTAYSKGNITRSAQSVLLFILGLSLLSLIGELVVMFGVIDKSIKNPIKILLEAVKQISAGDYTKRVTLNTQDELSELAIKFNSMIDVINERDRTLDAKVHERTRQLNEKNRAIEAILGNISQGIFTLSVNSTGGEALIESSHSKQLEEIFQLKPMAGLSLQTLVENHFKLPREKAKSLLEGITSSFRRDRTNWERTSHLLPQEIDFAVAGAKDFKKLAFAWDAICNDKNEVTRVLVSVRDLTELKKLQDSARQQKEELERIGQILQVGSAKMGAFVASSLRHLEPIELILSKNKLTTADQDTLIKALRAIYGNAGALKLNRISILAHDCEKAALAWQPEDSAKRELEALAKEVKLYVATLAELTSFRETRESVQR